MRIRRYPFVLAALAGVVASGLLTAREHGSAASAVAYAATRTLDAGSSRIEIRVADARGHEVFRVTGVLDFQNHRGRLEAEPEGEQTIIEGNVTYFRIDWLPDLKDKWVRSDVGADDPLDLQQRILLDPAQLLAFLHRASVAVKEVGREEVRGVMTTHYEGTVDLQKLVEQAAPSERPKAQEEGDSIGDDGPTAFRYGIWVDEDQVARRLRAHGDEETWATIDFYDFGIPMQVDAPSRDQVITQDELFEAIQRDSCSRVSNEPEAGSGGIHWCVSGETDLVADGHK